MARRDGEQAHRLNEEDVAGAVFGEFGPLCENRWMSRVVFPCKPGRCLSEATARLTPPPQAGILQADRWVLCCGDGRVNR
jgi:hypothetical protein